MQSLPKYWKTQLKQENGLLPIKSKMIDTLLQVKQANRFAYKLLTQFKNNEEDKSQQKWNTTFINEDLNWKKIYSIPIIATNDMKIRDFKVQMFKKNNTIKCFYINVNWLAHLYVIFVKWKLKRLAICFGNACMYKRFG